MYKVLGSDQQVYGPVNAAQLRQWMAEGRVSTATLVQLEGAADWKPLGSTPEFAVPPPVNLPHPPARAETDQMALGGLVCGILSILCCCASLPFGVLGLILSIIVLSRRQEHPAENSRQMALAGLIFSILGLLWHCLLPLAFVVPGPWRIHHYRWRI
jgi:hypothetical protein